MDMTLEHSGWSQARGWFCDKYSIDTTRTDHEIHWTNGRVCKQLEPFHTVETDWNCDGDVYTEFGANFEGYYGYGRDWWTPENLLSLMLDGEAIIPGIKKL
jgi:hypothetical protein